MFKNVGISIDASGNRTKVVNGLHDHFVGRIEWYNIVGVNSVFVVAMNCGIIASLILPKNGLVS